ncbi:MAG: site-specific DNA-methyltransferase, partial [Deltaproteobacteria bacterium]|nr:site-specific DNA-methyltransferase [Deltaproteobacteria bacterium]
WRWRRRRPRPRAPRRRSRRRPRRRSRSDARGLALPSVPPAAPVFSFRPQGSPNTPVRLLEGDAADAAAALAREGVLADLLYIDPPFASGARYFCPATVAGPGGTSVTVERPAFADPLRGGPEDYLTEFAPRLDAACRALRPGGSLYVHLDWRVAAHVRVHLDRTLGFAALRNEIVWRRNPPLGRKARAGQFGRVTDTILFYVRPGGAPVFHAQAIARRAAPGSYRLDPATGQAFRTAPRGDYTDASVARLEGEGRIHRTRSGQVRIRYDLEPAAGGAAPDGEWVEQVPVDSLWLDIPDAMHVPPSERTGYATQKPEALLERIVSASTDPEALVLDPMCGSGTTLAVAARLGRRAIGADRSRLAVHTAFARLARAGFLVRVERLDGADPEPGGALDVVAGRDGTVKLTGYRPGLVPDWPGAAAAVEAAGESRGLALLEGWGIDPEGLAASPVLACWFGRSAGDRVPLDAALPRAARSGAPRVFAFDVFGNRSTARIELP